MSLLQSTVVQKYLKTLNEKQIKQKWEIYKAHFHDPIIQENIRNVKEEQYQEGFFRDLFVDVLGYTLNPETDFNLTTELKNVKDSKKADGGIIVNNKVVGVVELKGTDTTDLSKVENQAFGYKNNQSDCNYVIISNFEKLRFYIDNAINHIKFDLFKLTEDEFRLLYLCLGYENIKKNIPLKLKKESVSQEDIITKQLYEDYSLFKRELFNNLTALNPTVEPLLLFKKSQKLLDRFLFLFFAEDRHLLPPNSVRLILKQWKQLKELDAYTPLFDRFKKYFGYLNTGHKGKQYNVYPYNGGLFKPDEVLDTIEIDDDLLYKHTLNLSEYDFNSEVDVNILGHIFENSLNEIEEIQTQLEENSDEIKVSKRKKDGVFYTPKYITKYIVENTVGKLCEEKKTELNITDEEYAPAKKRSRKKINNLNIYRKWLLQLTIVDPACGSGAFLNEALNFLIAEHGYIDELSAKYNKDELVLSDVEKNILENNLFGVDINNESVEIAKLSLWLRTAQPNRKLNDLSGNIKCGNSLIDDLEVAGDKAFNWEKEFPQVFENGGFDVVIGNPPYVQSLLTESEKQFFDKYYYSSEGKPDLYRFFIEKGINLLKNNGQFSFITPNSFLTIPSSKKLRQFIKDKSSLRGIINFEGMVFKDANINTVIFFIEKSESKEYIKVANDKSKSPSAETLNLILLEKNLVSYDEYKKSDIIQFVKENKALNSVIKKIKNNSIKLSEVAKYTLGLQVYHNTIHSKEEIKNRVYHNFEKLNSSFIPEIGGKNLSRYFVSKKNTEFVSFGDWCYNKPDNFFLNEKRIFIREIPSHTHLISSIYEGEGVPNKAIIIVKSETFNIFSLLGILNSKLIGFYIHKTTEKGKQKLFPRISLTSIRNLPISTNFNSDFQEFVECQHNLVKEYYDKSASFIQLLTSKFNLTKPSKKLQNWHDLEFGEFLKELEKARKKSAKENQTEYSKLTLNEEAEWMQYFNEQKQKAEELKAEIDKTDKEIDQMVYELYGLTEEEIEIVENS